MPATYRKAPRALVLASESADYREAQPSDNDFTVLLQRESPRLAVVPAAPRERPSVAPARRLESRVRLAPPPFPDADRTAPPTVASVAPPPPTTVSVAAPPPVSSSMKGRRRKQSTLVAGALAFVAFGSLAGIGVELALRAGGEGPSQPAVAAALVAQPPAPAPIPMPTIAPVAAGVAAGSPASALGGAASVAGAPDTKVVGWTADPSLSSTHDPLATLAIHAAHHHRKHHHTGHAQPLVARVVPPPPTPAPPPDALDPGLAEYAPSSVPPVAAAPAATPGGTPDEMAAAQQMLTQAKAELSL